MTRRADGRVEPGAKINGLSASAWNRAQDAADLVLGAAGGASEEEKRFPFARNWIYARCGSSFPGRSWVSLVPGAPPVNFNSSTDPNAAKRQFSEYGTVVGDAYPITDVISQVSNSPWQLGSIGYAMERGQSGGIVRIQIHGPVFTYLILRHRFHTRARFSANASGTAPSNGFGYGDGGPQDLYLESALAGPLKITWVDVTNYAGPVPSGAGAANICAAVVGL